MKKKAKNDVKEVPDIMQWYNEGDGICTIEERLENEYGYTESEAYQLIDEIIYG